MSRNGAVCRGVAAVLAMLAGLLLAACQTTGSSSEVGHYVVSVASTPMFRYGPAQSFGADFSLTEGTHVVMLKREFGYSRVMTDAGQTGYVATEDLKPAPPPEPSTTPGVDLAQLRSLRPRGGGGISAANSAVIQSGPLFGGDDLPPLPEHDPLADAPPGFRVNVGQRKPGDVPPAPKPGGDAKKPGEEKGKPGFRVNVPAPDATAKKP